MFEGNTNLQKFDQNEDYEQSLADSNFRTITSSTSFEGILAKFKNYRPKSNTIDLKKLHGSTYVKLKKYRDAAYYGEIINGKRQGFGVMIYANDRIYEGEWSCDYKNGKGYEELVDGCVFQGQYVNGKPEGVGKHQWPNGEFYEGEWLSGLKHGSGMWSGAKGDSYVGEWKFGKADGYGIHVWINGDRYEGQFKQCLKHGSGTERFANGDIYKGEFIKGKPYGYGEYYWKNGSYYKGHFKNGKRDGQGIWKKISGISDKYEGQYEQDKKQGYGIFTWHAGNVYKGNYVNDEREGYGEMYWIDGSYFKGQWLSGVQEGSGIIYTPESGIKKGIFKNNELIKIIIEEEPVINVPITIKRRKLKAKSKSNSNKIMPVSSKNHAFNERAKNYISLDVGKRPPQGSFKERVKNYSSNRSYSKNTSHRALASPNQSDDYKSFIFKFRNIPETQSKNLSPIQESRKQHLPHSSVYMHKIEKRMAALAHSANPYRATPPRRIHTNNSHHYAKIPTSQDSGRLNQSTFL